MIAVFLIYMFPVLRDSCISVYGYSGGMDKSLGFVAVQSRGGIITIPAEARRALRLDAPGAQVEVILRDHDLVLIPHVAVPLAQMPTGTGEPAQPGS
jgi:AbrB family looped-hinge helix DNA binding protein